MKKIVFAVLIALSFSSVAQQPTIYSSSQDEINFGAHKMVRSGTMYGFDNEPVGIEGSSYADSTWKQGSFIFYPTKKEANAKADTVAGFMLRYDVYKKEVDILHKNKVFAATADMLQGFIYQENLLAKTHYFVNLDDYRGDVSELKGFIEQLSKGKINLFKYYHAELKKPDYNPTLSVGTKNYQIQQKSNYYYSVGKNLRTLNSTRLSNLCEDLFGSKSEAVKKYAKEQNLNSKKEEDLAKIFNYFNSL
jgi:hypothetical protein